MRSYWIQFCLFVKAVFASAKVRKIVRLALVTATASALGYLIVKYFGIDKSVLAPALPALMNWGKKLLKLLAETAVGEWVKTTFGRFMKHEALSASASQTTAANAKVPAENLLISMLVFVVVLVLYAAL
ncbi:MAG: hypothetical protein J0M12_11565 [Deltaproteobacteria bacterium]|nr:hypothetical protein [Deltaproteobacteria bacterium]